MIKKVINELKEYNKLLKNSLKTDIDSIDGFDNKNRIDHLIRTIPDVFENKSVLYVGASPNRNQLVSEFKSNGAIVDLVEVNPNNIEINRNNFNVCYEGYIRTFIPPKKYDAVVFWHGIEHIGKWELPSLVEQMKTYAKKLILFGCPYGLSEQGAIYGNEHEVHVSHWEERELWDMGLYVSSIGKKDSGRCNLVSYIRVSNNENTHRGK